MAHTSEEVKEILGTTMPGWEIVNDGVTRPTSLKAPDDDTMRRRAIVAHDEPQVVVIRQDTPHGFDTRTVTLQHGRVTQIQTHPTVVSERKSTILDYQERLEELEKANPVRNGEVASGVDAAHPAVRLDGDVEVEDESTEKLREPGEPIAPEDRLLVESTAKPVDKSRKYKKYKNTSGEDQIAPESASPAVNAVVPTENGIDTPSVTQ